MKPKKYYIFMCVIIACFILKSDLLGQEYLSKLKEGAIEWTENRTAYSKTFLNPDGTNTAVISVAPIHFVDNNGNWRKIEDELPIEIPYSYLTGVKLMEGEEPYVDQFYFVTPSFLGRNIHPNYIVHRSYIRWSTSSIPDGSTINDAEFNVNLLTFNNNTEVTFGWYPIGFYSQGSGAETIYKAIGEGDAYGELTGDYYLTDVTLKDDKFVEDIENLLIENYIAVGLRNSNESSSNTFTAIVEDDPINPEHHMLIVNYTPPTPTVLYVQNETIEGQEPPFEATQQIFAGSEVTIEKPYGDVIITSTADVTFRAGNEIMIEPGFHVYEGAEFHACIKPFFHHQLNRNNSTPTNSSTANNTREMEDLLFQDENTVASLESTISVYPNPNTGVFDITFLKPVKEPFKVEVRNMMGVIVFKNEINGERTYQVDISKHPAGLYIVHISIGNQLFIEKIFKQH